MGLWFFLTTVVVGNMVLKAYKWRTLSRDQRLADDRVLALELELKAIQKKIQQLDEAVFLDDFELKRQFSKLEQDMAKSAKHPS